MDVEQGHHIQTAIRFSQGQRCRDILGRCRNIALQQGHTFDAMLCPMYAGLGPYHPRLGDVLRGVCIGAC